MATDIGKLALKLTADATSLAGDLGKAALQIGGFGTKVNATLKKAFTFDLKGLAGQGSGLLKTLETAVTDPLKVVANAFGGVADIVDKVPVVGGLLAVPFKAAAGAAELFSDAIGKSRDDMLALGHAANRLGIDIADLQVFSKLPGLDAEKAEKLVTKFQKALGSAAIQGGFADNPFNQLGLDATDLAGGKTIDSLKAFADRFAALPNAVLQSKLALDVFGKQGLLIAPTLRQGAAGIGDVEKKLQAFGLNVGQGAFRSALELNKRAAEFKNLREGFFNQLSQAALPILGEINSLFPKITEGFGGLAPKIIDVAEVLAEAGASLVDAFNDGRLWEEIKRQARDFTEVLKKGIIDAAKELPFAKDAQATKDFFGGLFAGPKAVADFIGGVGGSVKDFFTGDTTTQTFGRPAAFTEAERAATLGRLANRLLPGGGGLFDFENGGGVPGATTAARDAAAAFIARVRGRLGETRAEGGPDALAAALTERARDLDRALNDPAKKFQETILDTLDLFSKSKALEGFAGKETRDFLGISSILPTQLELAFPGLKEKLIGKGFADFLGASGLGTAQATPALVRDSSAAAAAIQAFQRQNERADPIEQLKAIQEQALELQRENVRVSEAIERAVREGRLKLVGGP